MCCNNVNNIIYNNIYYGKNTTATMRQPDEEGVRTWNSKQ